MIKVRNQMFILLFTIYCLLFAAPAHAETKEFVLTVTDGEIELNGAKFMVWKFNNMFPGPEIRVKEGDVVKIKLRNMSSAKHGLFFHGLKVNPRVALQEQEIFVEPDYEYTYGEFVAGPPGTHLYHCSYNMAEHLSRGFFGAFIVEEAKPVPTGFKQGDEPKFDKEFVYIFSDWNSKSEKAEDRLGAGHPSAMLDNDITAINDRAVTGNNPIIMEAKVGERVRIRLANLGQLPHKISFAEGFLLTHEDGYRISEPKKQDSLTIYPGKRYDIAITAKKSGKKIFYHTIEMPLSAGKRLAKLESQQRHGGENKQDHTKALHDSSHDIHKPVSGGFKQLPILVLDIKGEK